MQTMKKIFLSNLIILVVSFSLFSQSADPVEVADAQATKNAFLKKDPGMSSFFNTSYAYVIFPKIGKGAMVVGGAGGKGIMFKNDTPIGEAKMTQVTVGFQAGGQAYSEVIFFENEAAFNDFTGSKYEFAAQVSAVAAIAGASADAPYKDGVAVFTLAIGGLMYEASVGGQKFKYKAY